jgi:23S rRNA pseudouridine955/2504/2580 synthase
MAVRVPPLPEAPCRGDRRARAGISDDDAEMIQAAVMWKDEHIIAMNKPPGLPSQGGSGQGDRHVDGLSEALKFGYADRRNWSTGWTRTPRASCCWRAPTRIARRAVRGVPRPRHTRKIYWAVVAGVPRRERARSATAWSRRPAMAGAARARR